MRPCSVCPVIFPGSFSGSFSNVCGSCLSRELSSMGCWVYADCLSRLCPFLHWKERSHAERLHSYGWKVATRGKPLRSSSRVGEVSHLFIYLPLPHLCLSQFREACVARGTVLFHARASRPFRIACVMLSPFPFHPPLLSSE